MTNSQQPISILLCACLVISTMGLDSCKKEEGKQAQAPAATYAVPTPEELYQKPENLFVAGFIGNMRMNLLSCRYAGAGSRFS